MEYLAVKILSEGIARSQTCIPLALNNQELEIAVCENTNTSYITEFIYNQTGLKTKLIEKPKIEIIRLINTYYSIELNQHKTFEEILTYTETDRIDSLFFYTLREGIKVGASDIHVILDEEKCIIKFRILGILKVFSIISVTQGKQLIRIIKVNSGLEITDTILPLDSRMSYETKEQKLDIRISIIKTYDGEKATLRLLDSNSVPKKLENLGISSEKLEIIRRYSNKASGFILVTGPTGHGKSTTLRCIINDINNGEKHIISIENPVEYKVEGITQIQTNRNTGDFNMALVASLRQDPDVIYIGEIRDEISAYTAIRGSITGHLVFATLHTNTSAEGVIRLKNLGIENYLLASGLKLIINQRLFGKLCECKESGNLNLEEGGELDLKEGTKVYTRKGCALCGYSGYVGLIPGIDILEGENIDFNNLENASKTSQSWKEEIKKLILGGEICYKEAMKHL